MHAHVFQRQGCEGYSVAKHKSSSDLGVVLRSKRLAETSLMIRRRKKCSEAGHCTHGGVFWRAEPRTEQISGSSEAS